MLVWIRSSPFLMKILFIFVTPCFPRADAISSSVANAKSLFQITPFGSVKFLMRVRSAFGRMKRFYY